VHGGSGERETLSLRSHMEEGFVESTGKKSALLISAFQGRRPIHAEGEQVGYARGEEGVAAGSIAGNSSGARGKELTESPRGKEDLSKHERRRRTKDGTSRLAGEKLL